MGPWFLIGGITLFLTTQGWAEDTHVLQDPTHHADRSVHTAPDHRLALGVSYLGGQLRYYASRRWAAELQFQHGSASSDFGSIEANVFGLRIYRYIYTKGRMACYLGPELAWAKAEAQGTDYRTSGMVGGAFVGFDYYVTRRLSIGADIGPYVIALKEQVTGLTQTSLDFVINTAFNWHFLK